MSSDEAQYNGEVGLFYTPSALPGRSTRQFQLLRYENIRELLSEEHVDMKELVIYPFIPTYLEL